MYLKVGLLLLFVLGVSWSCNARQLLTSEMSDLKMKHEKHEMDVHDLEKTGKNENVCTLCEQYTSQALDYIADNKTQAEIIDSLHTSCSKLRSFKQECVTLVDYYAPLFFLEVSTVQPGDFCQKVNLCEQVTVTSTPLYQDSCGFCHQAVEEVLQKLKDPDTQLEILEILLKACDAADNYQKKCKKMVFEYGPMLITNGEKFLQKTDVCSAFHACDTSTEKTKQEAPLIVLSDI